MYEWFPTNPILASFISIALNIIIAITGVLPSAFITLGTVGVLGFEMGLMVLIVGEALGAIVSFIWYRKGLNKLSTLPKIRKIDNKLLRNLKNTDGIEAFFLVITLRLLPFVPSGIVTLTASFSKMSLLPFSVSSTLGKIPALFFEAYSVVFVLELKVEWQLSIGLIVLVFFLLYLLLKKKTNA